MLHANQLLKGNGEIVNGDFSYEIQSRTFSSRRKGVAKNLDKPYFVEGLPMEVHIHGIGHLDFSKNARDFDMNALQRLLSEEGVIGIPTVFLDHNQLNDFCELMERFSNLKGDGELQNVLGFALEGPVLVSAGGTPAEGNWRPTWEEWKKIASCGQRGLQYVVVSPDWDIGNLGPVVELLLSNGIRPALGHCKKNTVQSSLDGIYKAVDTASRMGFGPYSGAVITDHLFNDMPRNFMHAWRTVEEKRRRSRELVDLCLNEWSFDRLDKQIGEVPATLMKFAREGLITLLLNFDGEHVDLQVSRRTYEMVGADGIIAMTDRIETNTLGKWNLRKAEVGTLWYQDKGFVAAGSSNLDEQMKNMRSLGIPEQDIWKMCSLVPAQIFGALKSPGARDERPLSYVDDRDARIAIDAQQRIDKLQAEKQPVSSKG